jgi:hypothetical protein
MSQFPADPNPAPPGAGGPGNTMLAVVLVVILAAVIASLVW